MNRTGRFVAQPDDRTNDSGGITGSVADAGEQKANRSFRQSGYAVLRGIVAGPLLSFLREYALKSSRAGKLNAGDTFMPDTPCRDSDPFMDSLLARLISCVEITTGLKLFPTYSYFRVYKRGDILSRHTDRNACEISLSLSLGTIGAESRPIHVECAGADRSILLEPGDALLYKGIEIPHWRQSFTGEQAAQVFLHYVNQEGPFRDLKFDEAPHLNTSEAVERIMEQFRLFLGNPATKV